jgi:hypothetical protein
MRYSQPAVIFGLVACAFALDASTSFANHLIDPSAAVDDAAVARLSGGAPVAVLSSIADVSSRTTCDPVCVPTSHPRLTPYQSRDGCYLKEGSDKTCYVNSAKTVHGKCSRFGSCSSGYVKGLKVSCEDKTKCGPDEPEPTPVGWETGDRMVDIAGIAVGEVERVDNAGTNVADVVRTSKCRDICEITFTTCRPVYLLCKCRADRNRDH